MNSAAESKRGRLWADAFRLAPIGVLILGALLFFVGAGMLMSGVFFLIAGARSHWPGWLGMLMVGPLAVYVALRFVLLHRPAWLVIVALLVLLIISSLLRAALAGEPPILPVLEVVLESAAFAYLIRPRVREAFGPEPGQTLSHSESRSA